jgi:hypothetical protein
VSKAPNGRRFQTCPALQRSFDLRAGRTRLAWLTIVNAESARILPSDPRRSTVDVCPRSASWCSRRPANGWSDRLNAVNAATRYGRGTCWSARSRAHAVGIWRGAASAGRSVRPAAGRGWSLLNGPARVRG